MAGEFTVQLRQARGLRFGQLVALYGVAVYVYDFAYHADLLLPPPSSSRPPSVLRLFPTPWYSITTYGIDNTAKVASASSTAVSPWRSRPSLPFARALSGTLATPFSMTMVRRSAS